MQIGDIVKFKLEYTFYGEGEIMQIPLRQNYIYVKLTKECGGYPAGTEISVEYGEIKI